MRSSLPSLGIAAALILTTAACGKDAQTEDEVLTKTSAGEASTSISGDSADKRGQALVRVANAVPGMNGLVVRSDETRSLPSVDFKKVTDYTPITNDWVTFQVGSQPAGTYSPLETNREVLTDGHRYTMLVMHDEAGTGYQTRIVRDDISTDQSKAHLRVIHAAPKVDEVNVVAKGGDKLFDGINFTSEAGFKDVDPWAGTLEFRTEDGNRLLGTLGNADLKAGVSYTIVLATNAQGKLDAFWFEDQQLVGQ